MHNHSYVAMPVLERSLLQRLSSCSLRALIRPDVHAAQVQSLPLQLQLKGLAVVCLAHYSGYSAACPMSHIGHHEKSSGVP